MSDHIHSEITKHIEWLEVVTAESLAEVKIISAELECVEDTLRSFLEEYYGEVGSYFLDLERVKRDLENINRASKKSREHKNGDEFDLHSEDTEQVCEVKVKRKAIHEEKAKQLYRKLAKMCHPDTSDLPDAKEIFTAASKAYEKNDLCGLIALEQTIMESKHYEDEGAVEKLERLEQKYQMVLKERDLLLQRKWKLKYSPAYNLWQAVFRERAKGRDLVREIKNNVMQELNEKKKILEDIAVKPF